MEIKRVRDLVKGDIFEAPNGYIMVCVDNTAKSGVILITAPYTFYQVEIMDKEEYCEENTSWTNFDPMEEVNIKGNLLKK